MFNTRIFENQQSGGTPAINIPAGENTNNASGSANSANQPQPIDITYQRQHSIFNNRFRRESLAHSQGMGGVSWGSVTIGSWLKDEVMMSTSGNQNNHHLGVHGNIINPRRGSFRQQPSMSPPLQTSYLPDLEADYCKDYSCCGELLPTLHDLLRHYEEAHIFPSPPSDNSHMLNNRQNFNSHNMMETVSTTDVFLNTNGNNYQFTGNYQFGDQAQKKEKIIHQPPPPPPPQPPRREEEDDAMYIDDPARHLYVMDNDENKPFKCPVIGCEKTYKNQNGLKYHRLHGHQGQTLKENADGTISIIDPESNTPYLDGAGMEKDKPYRCEVCGKRYKNLNGLKYHRGHTTH